MLIVAPIVGFCVSSMFCCTLLCVLSSFAIILMGKRESWLLYVGCPPGVLKLFLTVPWIDLQCVIVVFLNHTHLLFSYSSILLRISKEWDMGHHAIPRT